MLNNAELEDRGPSCAVYRVGTGGEAQSLSGSASSIGGNQNNGLYDRRKTTTRNRSRSWRAASVGIPSSARWELRSPPLPLHLLHWGTFRIPALYLGGRAGSVDRLHRSPFLRPRSPNKGAIRPRIRRPPQRGAERRPAPERHEQAGEHLGLWIRERVRAARPQIGALARQAPDLRRHQIVDAARA